MIRVNTLFKSVCYHPGEHQLLTAGTDRKIGYWESLDASTVRELDGSQTGSINALDVSADGLYFVCGGDDKMVKVILVIITYKLSTVGSRAFPVAAAKI